ncbi:MAG: hypothetical protein H7336_12190 [Bacteriovorax sp.]|nr:hypothetical protein [Bacteriovorax sp.]
MKLISLLSALVLSTSLLSSVAFAEEAKKEEAAPPAPVYQEAGFNFVGASLGIAKPVGSNLSVPLRFNYGAEFSHALHTCFAVGAFASRNNGVYSHSSTVDFGITRIGLQAIFSPTFDSYFDVRAGYSFLDASIKVGNVTINSSSDSHPLFAGPGFGFILPVMDKLVLSPNLHYARFFKTNDSEAFNVFDVMLTLRYTL